MAAPLSPTAMLATSMHAQPGVYAVLLGSGVSTGAGMPTGWGVVTDLVRKVAAQEDAETVDQAGADPEAWWRDHHGEDLGYSSLLKALAPTAAARQGLLAGYFEPTEAEREEGVKAPSDAHRAIAKLMKKGYVKVIVTTNFDRLMEQALEAEGVAPQVIARPEAVAGMEPLPHAPATVIKLHGDYKDLGSLNTPEELASYPEQWNGLLRRVLDEYGLVISGWSADWDTALVALMEASPNRRYPLYWDDRSSKGEAAQRLLTARSGTVVPAAGADEMFTQVLANVEALERLAESPLTTAMAVARLKRYLPDPVRRIDLHDLVMKATEDVVRGVIEQPLSMPGDIHEALEQVLEEHTQRTHLLRTLLVYGVHHDDEGRHTRLWMDVLQRLIESGSRRQTGVRMQRHLEMVRLYPALLTLTSIGTAATYSRRDDVLISLATGVFATVDRGLRVRLPAAQAIHPWWVIEHNEINALPNRGQNKRYAISHMLREDTRDVLNDLVPNDESYAEAFHGFEYRLSLLHALTKEQNSEYALYGPMEGEYVGEWAWDREHNVPLVETAFRGTGTVTPEWPWIALLGGSEEAYDDWLLAHREVLSQYKFHRLH